jgi:hypothetical protein
MPSVTRDKRKYGAPTVYSDKRRDKEERMQRAIDRGIQIEQDIEEGRRDGWSGRINPIFEE